MGWKIYFVLTVIGLILTTFSYMSHSVGFTDGLSYLVGFVAVIGLFCYVFNKYAFTPVVWRVVFWANIFMIPVNIIFSDKSKINQADVSAFMNSAPNVIAMVFFFIVILFFTIPLYVALYSLSKGKTHNTSPMGGLKLQITKQKRK